MTKLAQRCQENLVNEFRPVVLVPDEKVIFARVLFESEGMSARVQVQGIETYVGTNIEELALYSSAGIGTGVSILIRQYNDRIQEIESDQSLRIEEPKWMTSLLKGYQTT